MGNLGEIALKRVVPRTALAGCFGLISLQILAAEPDVSFICASEKVAYHMYFSESNKWEFNIEEDKSRYILKVDVKKNTNKWVVFNEREKNNIDPLIEYVCESGSSNSYLTCDSQIGRDLEKFNFNFITQKFDRITYSLGWVSGSKGVAMIYEFGSCEKQASN